MKKILRFLILIFTLTFSGCTTSEVKVGVKVELPETFYVYGVLDEHRATVIKVKGTLVFDKNFNNVGYTLTNQDGVEKHFNVKGKLYSKGPFYVYEFDYEECYDVLYKGKTRNLHRHTLRNIIFCGIHSKKYPQRRNSSDG